MSRLDPLTHAMSREELDSRISAKAFGAMGIVRININGMRHVNESGGKIAGDELLKKTAIVLEQTFFGDKIYRYSGDEFVIISTEEENVFLNRVGQLRTIAGHPENEYNFAIGYFFSHDIGDLNMAMDAGALDMAENKQIFYRTHPEQT